MYLCRRKNIVNFKENDIYALKIKDETSEYNGKFIILIKTEVKGWSQSTNKKLFRFKITNNKRLPLLEEIDDLEYIKTFARSYLGIFLPYDNKMTKKERQQALKKIKPDLDEYKYLYTYISEIKFINKNTPKDLIYIGNIEIEKPAHEYYWDCEYGYIMSFYSLENIVKDLLLCYEDYNQKQSSIFSKEGVKKVHERSKRDLKFFAQAYKKIEKMEKKGFNFDEEEEIEESLTYVGGEDEDPFK